MDAPGAIRRLRAIEQGKVRDHLLRLDSENRLLRFGGYVSDAHIKPYCDGLDWDRAVIIGYPFDGEVRGLGELKPMAAGGLPKPPFRSRGRFRTAAPAPGRCGD
jgi:hypothetical protein